jgi:ABC-type glycerol-3-phosphate transport system substrate-binding protein
MMKNLFLALLALLIVFSQYVVYRVKDTRSAGGVPVLYWASDYNPTHEHTAQLYRAWLKKNGFPDMELHVDVVNGNLQKLVVQGVAGVGPDLMDLFGWDLHYLHQIGLVQPLNALLSDLPVPAENHDPMVSNDLFIDGERMGFSYNAGTSFYFVNVDWLRKIGMPPPPSRWSVEAFEAYGREYVEKANRGRKEKTRSFFFNHVDRDTLRRSMGLGTFNETLSACTLNRPDHVAMLKRVQKWMEEDRFFPTSAEAQSVSVEQGSGGGNYASLLHRGYFGIYWSGMAMVRVLRECKPPVELALAESPNAGYPNSISRTFATAIYSGSPNQKLARYFLLYLASESHNLQIAGTSIMMPPISSFRDRDAFMKPAQWTNEWAAKRAYRDKARELGIPSEYSPFVAYTPWMKEERRAWDSFINRVITAEEACALVEKQIQALIEANLARDPALRRRHEEALKVQARIDEMKRKGERIPLELVKNPFLHRYYRDTGRGV